MSFEEIMTAFYMAFAEEKLEQMCQSLSNMRLIVQNDVAEQKDRAASTSEENARQLDDDAAIRQEMLLSCETKAQSTLERQVAQLKQACSSGGDIDSVLSQFYVCAELGGATEASPAFTGYLSRTFQTQSRGVLDRVAFAKSSAQVNENGYIERTFYVDAISEIMTGATDVMNAVADANVPPATLQSILTPIHGICGDVTLEIVHLYALDARMMAWERRALDQARRDHQVDVDVESDESLQMVDLLLDELSFILRLLMSYSAFLKSLFGGEETAASTSRTFAAKIQELHGVYLILERFYIFQSTHKATEIAEVHELENSVFVSSLVEDVSFVLHKSFFRASQCLSYHTSLSVVIAIVDALESTYLPAIVNLPNRLFTMPQPSSSNTTTTTSSRNTATDHDHEDETAATASFSDLLLAAVDDDLTKSLQQEAKLLMAINSSFMSGAFVESLNAKICEFSQQQFPHDALIIECLPKPLLELNESFQSIVENEVNELLENGIFHHLKPFLTNLMMDKKCDYNISSQQYDTFLVHGSPMMKLVETQILKNKLLRKYQNALCTKAFEDLVVVFTQKWTKWVEISILQFCKKGINELGALLLEREVSQTLENLDRAFVVVGGKTSLRSCFTRLFQLVLVVNLMEPMEMLNYSDGDLVNEFTALELQSFLQLRVEFTHTKIHQAIQALPSKKK